MVAEEAKMAEYHENGCIMDVTVLEDYSDKERVRYRFRINKILQSSGLFEGVEEGKEFTAEKKRGVVYSGLWHLFDYKKQRQLGEERISGKPA
jgi:hypothetical protein